MLRRAYLDGGLAVRGDYARTHAPFVALAASARLLTSIHKGIARPRWYITGKGLSALEKK